MVCGGSYIRRGARARFHTDQLQPAQARRVGGRGGEEGRTSRCPPRGLAVWTQSGKASSDSRRRVSRFQMRTVQSQEAL